MTRREDELTSGFARFDFLLTVCVADSRTRDAIAARCEADWGGTRIGESTWEIVTTGSPAAFEAALEPLLRPGDRAIYYYLADSKRFFRVVVNGG